MARTNDWTRDQRLLALRIYLRLPFGKLSRTNRDIIALAKVIGRTPDALAMKAVNFAGIDPNLHRAGLSGASKGDRELWAEFEANPTKIALEIEDAATRLKAPQPVLDHVIRLPTGPTEKDRVVKVRLVQTFFRDAVQITYDSRCAISGISCTELLTASHIIPWSVSVEHRADPRNGLCLNALFDRAFDRGLFTFDEDHRVVLSKRLRDDAESAKLPCSLLEAEGKKLTLPKRFPPLAESLEYHQREVFRG